MDSTPSAPGPGESAPPQEGPPHLQAGQVVARVYRVVGLLGEGGMGAVYKVEHVHMRKAFALKVLHPDMSSSPEVVARFEREAVAAARIGHPNVAAATDFGRLDDGCFYLVLEFVAGRSLRDVLEGGPLAPTRALAITRAVTLAVAAAHANGIVHRDLKPENVMLTERDGDPDFVKVLDFGIAKLDGPTARGEGQPLTRIGEVFGTPDYMAPEQALGESVDGRADLYAIGVMFFEMLSGERPFGGGAFTVMRMHVVGEIPELPAAARDRLAALPDPHGVQAIVLRLLQKDRNARYADASELLRALELALAAKVPHEGAPHDEQAAQGEPPAQAPLASAAARTLRLPLQLPLRLSSLRPAHAAALAAGLGFGGVLPLLILIAIARPPPPATAPAVRAGIDVAVPSAVVRARVPPPAASSAAPAKPPAAGRRGGGGGRVWWNPGTW